MIDFMQILFMIWLVWHIRCLYKLHHQHTNLFEELQKWAEKVKNK